MIKNFKRELRDSDYKRYQFVSILRFAAVVIAITLIAGLLFKQSPPRPPTGRTDIASDFPEGVWFGTSEPLSLYDQLKGHVVVVLFNDFNTLSDLEDLTRLADIDSIFLEQSVICMVVSAGRSPAKTDSLVNQWHIECPVLADPDSTAMHYFGIRALPGILVIDTASRVAARYYEDWQNAPLEDVIEDLLHQALATRSLASEKFIPHTGICGDYPPE